MVNNIEKLRHQFSQENRFAAFGPVLLELEIQGIKGTNCHISFDFPITAIAGYNGAGKSTIAQIALCMYKSPDKDELKRKYLKDFFVKTLLDKQPYESAANITAVYASDNSSTPVQMTLFPEENEGINNTKKNVVRYAIDRWAGYRHQPEKPVFYYGMSLFIPYQEQNSNLLRDSNANVAKISRFSPKIVKKVADILSIDYVNLFNNQITNEYREERVLSAAKASVTYSENHMGCGEGRLLKLVNALENAPEKSLFVIEEPETALHQNAQYKLAQYFIDVCLRKKHQIIFTTHSPEIQKALPQDARKFIQRNDNGETFVIDSPSIAQIENYLSDGHTKRMIVVTEDDISALYLKEILRSHALPVFKNCQIFPMTLGWNEVRNYVKRSQSCGIKIYGVLDENKHFSEENCVAAFPEDTAPEISVLSDINTATEINSEFNVNCQQIITSGIDHHSYFDEIAKKSDEELSYVKSRCIKIYVKNKGKSYFSTLISQLKKWLSQCN